MPHYPGRSVSEVLHGGASDPSENKMSGLAIAVVVIVLVVLVVILYKRYQTQKEEEEAESKKKKELEAQQNAGLPDMSASAPAPSDSAALDAGRYAYGGVRGSIMDQAYGLAREEREGEVLSRDGKEVSGGARALPSSVDLAQQSMDQYEQLSKARTPGDRTRQEGENPMFHSQFYYEEGVEQHAEPGSGDAEREVMGNLVSATGGLLTQAEDLFAAGNDAYERDAWGMYKPSLATLQKARDLGSRVAGGVMAQASDSWGGRKVGPQPDCADPNRSIFLIQDQLMTNTKVPIDTFVQDVLAGNITAGSVLPVANLPTYIA